MISGEKKSPKWDLSATKKKKWECACVFVRGCAYSHVRVSAWVRSCVWVRVWGRACVIEMGKKGKIIFLGNRAEELHVSTSEWSKKRRRERNFNWMEARERIRRKKVLNCFHVVNESQTTKKLLAALSLSLSLSLSFFCLSLSLAVTHTHTHSHTHTQTHTRTQSHALDFLLSSAMTCGSMHDQLPDEDSVSEGKMKTPHSLTLLLSLTYPRKHTFTPTHPLSPLFSCVTGHCGQM